MGSCPHFPFRRTDPLHPPAELREARAVEPVLPVTLWNGARAWVVTRQKEIREVLSDDERFSGRFGQENFPTVTEARVAVDRGERAFVGMDNPDHDRFRRMFTREFSVRRMMALEPEIRAIANRLIDELEEAGPPQDLVPLLAVRFPSLVMSLLFGSPYEDHRFIIECAVARHGLTQSPGEAERKARELADYCHQLIEARMALRPCRLKPRIGIRLHRLAAGLHGDMGMKRKSASIFAGPGVGLMIPQPAGLDTPRKIDGMTTHLVKPGIDRRGRSKTFRRFTMAGCAGALRPTIDSLVEPRSILKCKPARMIGILSLHCLRGRSHGVKARAQWHRSRPVLHLARQNRCGAGTKTSGQTHQEHHARPSCTRPQGPSEQARHTAQDVDDALHYLGVMANCSLKTWPRSSVQTKLSMPARSTRIGNATQGLAVMAGKRLIRKIT